MHTAIISLCVPREKQSQCSATRIPIGDGSPGSRQPAAPFLDVYKKDTRDQDDKSITPELSS
jgi:hypothetical protein